MTISTHSRQCVLRGIVSCGVLMSFLVSATNVADYTTAKPRIAVTDYRDRVCASWPDQIVGNINGLSYEFRFMRRLLSEIDRDGGAGARAELLAHRLIVRQSVGRPGSE